MGEIFKPIEGFKYYLVSNTGKVFSLRVNRVMKTYINNNGYECIKFNEDGKRTHYLIHRLVAKAFCEGYATDLVVNHKDGNRLHNVASNLEWCTTRENIHDMRRRGTMNCSKAQKVAQIKNRKPVIVTTPDNITEEFPSIKDACLKYNLTSSQASKAANGLCSAHKGYVFKFKIG